MLILKIVHYNDNDHDEMMKHMMIMLTMMMRMMTMTKVTLTWSPSTMPPQEQKALAAGESGLQHCKRKRESEKKDLKSNVIDIR